MYCFRSIWLTLVHWENGATGKISWPNHDGTGYLLFAFCFFFTFSYSKTSMGARGHSAAHTRRRKGTKVEVHRLFEALACPCVATGVITRKLRPRVQGPSIRPLHILLFAGCIPPLFPSQSNAPLPSTVKSYCRKVYLCKET